MSAGARERMDERGRAEALTPARKLCVYLPAKRSRPPQRILFISRSIYVGEGNMRA